MLPHLQPYLLGYIYIVCTIVVIHIYIIKYTQNFESFKGKIFENGPSWSPPDTTALEQLKEDQCGWNLVHDDFKPGKIWSNLPFKKTLLFLCG